MNDIYLTDDFIAPLAEQMRQHGATVEVDADAVTVTVATEYTFDRRDYTALMQLALRAWKIGGAQGDLVTLADADERHMHSVHFREAS